MNLRQMLNNVRIRCDGPLNGRPSDSVLLLQLTTQLQRFFNKTALSGKPWATDEVSLIVAAGSEDYPIGVDKHFGKPLQVRTVYPGDTNHIERDIDFFELGEINNAWPYPKSYGTNQLFGGPHTAQRIAFFRKSGQDQIYARVMPIPAQGAQYQILYQVGEYGSTTPLDESPMLPEFHALVEIRTAIASLPHCQWDDNKAENAAKRKELAMTLTNDSADLERDFLRYIATMSASTRPSHREMPFSID